MTVGSRTSCVRHSCWGTYVRIGLIGLFLLLLPGTAAGEAADPGTNIDLTELSLEELMSVEVTSVSKKKQKLSESAAAIFVITQEDLRRSGVTSIPEALRMVPGIQVARGSKNQWNISARGFNERFSNKLLVLIDGRTVYNPLFAGVTWETQDTILEDIERIEVIRGPGGALWGVNAVNGVINIITKKAQDTQGLLVSGVAGNEEGIVSMRQGGSHGSNLHYRIFSKYFNRGTSYNAMGAHDDTRMFRSGFRSDWTPATQDRVMIQGEIYTGDGGQQSTVATTTTFPFGFTTGNEDVKMSGGHFLSRWEHTWDSESDMALQFFYDRYERFEDSSKATIDTFDVDFQHRFKFLSNQELLWGLEYRYWIDHLQNTSSTSAFPDSRSFSLLSGFLQNEFTLIPDTLLFTLGTKLSHNDFTGFEYQPSGRFLWKPLTGHTIWGAVARAVRIPSRLEDNSLLRFAPNATTPFPTVVRGNQQFKSEDLLAFEVGYRLNTFERFTLDITGFYNQYDHVRGTQIISLLPPTGTLANNLKVDTIGVEVANNLQLQDWWVLRGAYTYINMSVEGPINSSLNTTGGNTPHHQGSLRSLMTLPFHLEFDSWIRASDNLPATNIAGYVELDLRLGWKPIPGLALSLVGQNLLDNHHPEAVPSKFLATQPTEVQRSFYGKITWSY
ncbi:MAG: TonB-dependent receptor [Nitrospirota bacterium]|nr:TonB-dependent receptor [Nitrospirota bacterium]